MNNVWAPELAEQASPLTKAKGWSAWQGACKVVLGVVGDQAMVGDAWGWRLRWISWFCVIFAPNLTLKRRFPRSSDV